jgi:MFS family permease
MSDAVAVPPTGDAGSPTPKRAWLFATCFVALVATSFAFMIRALIGADWGRQFGLSETQVGELFGAGLWPFAISIIIFSLFIDRVGYKPAMVFAFVCHVVSVAVTVMAPRWSGFGTESYSAETAYNVLYAGNFIAALAAGTVEAVINPVIASVYPKAKTKWLNILHAGWPGGIVIAGIIVMSIGSTATPTAEGFTGWQWKVTLLLIPTLIYGVMMLGVKFPVNERVAAGVSYKDMLREFGAAGAFIASSLILLELGNVFGWDGLLGSATLPVIGSASIVSLIGIAIITVGYFAVARSFGQPLFIFLLLVMILLAITELGTDSWIKSLMEPVMQNRFGISGGWVLVYSATVMMLLRLNAGPLTKRMNPLVMLAISSLFAAAGLAFLSVSAGLIIILAATIYAIGQSFFWPTTLGLIAERFPKGGALTLNAIAGVGMLGVGILGAPLIGLIQDRDIAADLREQQPALYANVAGDTQSSVLGEYQALDNAKVEALETSERETVTAIRDQAKQNALIKIAILPLIMFVCYVGLLLYFKAKGGYRPVVLGVDETEPQSKQR